jgi:putative ABC transport system substrate-binding protein
MTPDNFRPLFGKALFSLDYLLLAAILTCALFFVQPLAAADTYKIGVATLLSEPSLDEVQQGIKEELEHEGFVEGQNTEYIVQNANNQLQLAATIANDLASRDLSVIVPITTPMAQAVAKVARNPIVFAAVTDPVGAGLVTSIDRGEPNITGTSDAWPYEQQLKLIHTITPKVQRLGVLFNPGDAASQYGVRQIRKLSQDLGFTLVKAAVNSTNDVSPAARGLVGRVDALFLSSDSTVIAGIAAAFQVAQQNKLPLYVGDGGAVKNGGLAAYSVGYLGLGRDTGKLIARVLRGERNIPTVVEHGNEIYVNSEAAKRMGVTIPEAVLKQATKVYETIN